MLGQRSCSQQLHELGSDLRSLRTSHTGAGGNAQSGIWNAGFGSRFALHLGDSLPPLRLFGVGRAKPVFSLPYSVFLSDSMHCMSSEACQGALI